VGEHDIDEPAYNRCAKRISSLGVSPKASISPAAETALLNADLIILGPGDLYTSVLANCVVDGVADAIRHSGAKIVYVSNLMTKAGQTTGMGVAEHLEEITHYIKRVPDYVLLNTTALPRDLLVRYAEQEEYPVAFNYERVDVKVIPADLLAGEIIETASGDTLKRSLIRHDSRKLARKIMDLL
jgi:uncharacterized cofD-like protein